MIALLLKTGPKMPVKGTFFVYGLPFLMTVRCRKYLQHGFLTDCLKSKGS
jgi:hypothetical protein